MDLSDPGRALGIIRRADVSSVSFSLVLNESNLRKKVPHNLCYGPNYFYDVKFWTPLPLLLASWQK